MSTGILPVSKPKGWMSFSLIPILRKLTGVRTIGHAGTLDPFAVGVMVLLIGKEYTRLSAQFMREPKEYVGTIRLGIATDTYDVDGKSTMESPHIPPEEEVREALKAFQGTVLQTPPMFSAKKIQGKKLYKLARKGIHVERPPVTVTMATSLLSYAYPFLELHIRCSKGTYVRSIAHDLGQMLGCGAHLHALTRTQSGPFSLDDCADGAQLADPEYDWKSRLQKWKSIPPLTSSPLLRNLAG